MQLTHFTDFGLRVLMYLTQHERALPVTIGEIATQFDVPHNHLVKVVNRLGKLGWVSAVRGRNGGLRLAVEPDKLRLGAVLRGLENQGALIDCAGLKCVLHGSCALKTAMEAGLHAFYAHLDEYSLADVTARKTGRMLLRMHRQFLRQAAADGG